MPIALLFQATAGFFARSGENRMLVQRVLINAAAGGNVRSWGEAEGADGQTPLDSVENDPGCVKTRRWI